jgi:enolase
MNHSISRVHAAEILDSRGHPTLGVRVTLASGVYATSSVPSGASTGSHEAVELRDGDLARYNGRGVLRAVANVNDVLGPALTGFDVTRQAEIDERLVEVDGTPSRSRLGANAILGISQACARAAARAGGRPLYVHLGGEEAARMPVPMVNIINGGKHADNSLDVQEFMIVPYGMATFAEALRCAAETFHALHGLLRSRGCSTAVGDEGGFAPLLHSNEEACELILEAVEMAGYRPGTEVGLALDVAASSFCHEGRYRVSRTGQRRDKSSMEMLAMYQQWARKYPIVSIEDGLDEDDWEGFQALTATLGKGMQIVGDDLLVTNTNFIARAVAEKACNAALIKLNQIGTVTEAIAAVNMCREVGWGYVVSHRSGETDDSFIADFAVAMGGGQIKAGSVCRGERIAKYNRLLGIERELGERARFER